MPHAALIRKTRKCATMRVLVVEDEPKMARLLARGLDEEGHAADIAATGEDALWMAEPRRTTRSCST